MPSLPPLLMLPGQEAACEWIQKGMHGATAKVHKAEKKRWRELSAEMVQGSLAGGVRNTLRIANWIIRKELEGGR